MKGDARTCRLDLHSRVAHRLRAARERGRTHGRDPAAADRALRLALEADAYEAVARYLLARWMLDPEHDDELLDRALSAADRAASRRSLAHDEEARR